MTPPVGVLARRGFSLSDQRAFADLSGDCNPMHLDAVAARRTQAGEPVVHGLHALLWALEIVARHAPGLSLAGVKAKFEQFIPLDREVALSVRAWSETKATLDLHLDGMRTTTLVLRFGAPGRGGGEARASTPVFGAEVAVPLDRPTPIEGGAIVMVSPAGAYAQAFPALAARIGADRVGELATLSRLVGMISPGLHSIFAALDVALSEGDAPEGRLGFQVSQFSEVFRFAEILVEARGLSGTVDAFVRPPPSTQPGTAELSASVAPDAFAHIRALVIGGSRGLGEATAKLIAAGGGRVAITYAVGRDEAATVARDIEATGRACAVLAYDATRSAAEQLSDLPFAPNQLYYFATPRIFRQKTALFSRALLDEFTRVYVDGFHDACETLAARGSDLLAYYPSSVAVAERPRDATEYAMAKAAGEVLGIDMDRFMPGVSVYSTRLPRILTDQTATVAPVESLSAAEVMLPIVRTMSARGA